SSRRRHTRWPRDWSSDVCSSDLAAPRFSTSYTAIQNRPGLLIETHMLKDYKTRVDATYRMLESTIALAGNDLPALHRAVTAADEIGRASCRERVWRWGGGGW